MKPDFTIQQTCFSDAAAGIKQVRETVFIDEQQVPPKLEWDGLDEQAIHVVAIHDENIIGTARMLENGHIGRMAVLKPWRNKTVGTALLQTLLHIAENHKLQKVVLSAQITAIGFYEKLGFIASGDEFMDAGIPHRHMERPLQ